MIRSPPRTTLPYTRVPYSTCFRCMASIDQAMQTMGAFAGKSRAHAEIASAIADNNYYDMALVGNWYVPRGERDPAVVRELTDQQRLHAPDPHRKPGVVPWSDEERGRSEERRVGNECVRTCRSRWST